MRKIHVPTLEEAIKGGRSELMAKAFITAMQAMADLLAKNPDVSGDDLDNVFNATIKVETENIIEQDRRHFFPVPTIAEIVALGYDPKNAPDIVLGSLSRYSLMVSVPSIAAVIALGFDEVRARDIVDDFVAERRISADWGSDDDALKEKLRRLGVLMASDVRQPAQLRECVTDNSDALNVLGLLRRQMTLMLHQSGNVADVNVNAWNADLDALEAKIRGESDGRQTASHRDALQG